MLVSLECMCGLREREDEIKKPAEIINEIALGATMVTFQLPLLALQQYKIIQFNRLFLCCCINRWYCEINYTSSTTSPSFKLATFADDS